MITYKSISGIFYFVIIICVLNAVIRFLDMMADKNIYQIIVGFVDVLIPAFLGYFIAVFIAKETTVDNEGIEIVNLALMKKRLTYENVDCYEIRTIEFGGYIFFMTLFKLKNSKKMRLNVLRKDKELIVAIAQRLPNKERPS